MSMAASGRTISPITHILGIGDEVRLQNPELKKTSGQKPQWYIRPYVDQLDAETGKVEARQVRIYLGLCEEVPKRDAIRRKNEELARINRRQYIVQSQIPFGELLDTYLREYVENRENVAASTRGKYESHIRNHIRPAFGELRLAEVNTLRIDAFLKAKAKSGMAHATRTDLKNILCGIFTQAKRWGYWREENPAVLTNVGRERPVREQRKLTLDETLRLLAALREDVRLIVEVALFCGLRISEVLGLEWRHIDWKWNVIMVRQRWYRGDMDVVKTKRSIRDVPMGHLGETLRAIYPGKKSDGEFVFNVQTHVGRWGKPGVCRDDRDIRQHFLLPVARALGIYWPGFGFHSFRREAVTNLSAEAGPAQAQRMAGHSHADMTLHYSQADHDAQDQAIRRIQERFMGETTGGKTQ